MKGKVVKIYIMDSPFGVVEKYGIVKDVVKSKAAKDLFVIEVDLEGLRPEYKLFYRFENELK